MRMRRVGALLGSILTLAAVVSLATSARSATSPPRVVELRVDGVVDPFMADYVDGGIASATDEGAAAVLLTIDTPGGLDSSMREITQAILNSRIPVIGYVYPQGARAASAGTFILLATNVAAMAPATNVGAAHPVGVSGAIESEKATNDAAEYIVSIAEARDRNAGWAETAVRQSESISAEQALDLGVIDVIAPDVPSLLEDIDGWTVEVAGGQKVTLDLAGATVEQVPMGWFTGFLHALLNPNLAFIFFWLGLALIVLEFFVPGGIVGTIGALMLVSSFVALGMLPFQLIGVVLLVASVVFLVLELKHPGIGLPAVAGIVCLLLGGFFLFDPSVPSAKVSPLVLVPTAALAAVFFLVVVRAALRIRHAAVTTRDETLVGQEATVEQDLDPVGVVSVASEQWSAEAIRGTPILGDRVRIVGVDGLRLKVEPIEPPAERAAEQASPSAIEGRQP